MKTKEMSSVQRKSDAGTTPSMPKHRMSENSKSLSVQTKDIQGNLTGGSSNYLNNLT